MTAKNKSSVTAIVFTVCAVIILTAAVSCASRDVDPRSTDAGSDAANISQITNPPATEHPATEPSETEPRVTEPPATEQPAAEPSATEPPVTKPSATEPSATKPSETEPPETNPPETKPPETNPPETKPPETNPPETEPPETEPPETNPPKTEPDDPVVLREGKAEDGYLDKIMFYGDSTTYGIRRYKILGTDKTNRVWAPKSGTLALFNATKEKIYDTEADAEFTLSEMASRLKPEYLVITLGINGIASMKESYFKGEYIKVINIIKEASPDTKIILQTMYPISKLYTNTKHINMDKIRTGNGWIHDIAAETGCRLLDSFDWFLDDEGYMRHEFDNLGDGMHFNEKGYKHMIEFLVSHPYPKEG